MDRDPSLRLPAASSTGALLAREGLIQPQKRRARRRYAHPGRTRYERPHEARQPSTRTFPKSIGPPTYPEHFETRLVSDHGTIFFLHPKPTFIRTSLAGKCLGFDETEQREEQVRWVRTVTNGGRTGPGAARSFELSGVFSRGGRVR